MTNITTDTVIQRLKERDRTILGRAVSIIENRKDGYRELIDYAYRNAVEDTFVIGLTGAGGAGKSTLTDQLIRCYRKDGLRVGVLAVDPSSPYTGGAVLGDRVRMGYHNKDAGVFIRSFAARGLTGGLSHAAKEVLYLYKAFGFDVILIESVGVGQADTDITVYADATALVMAPGNGDAIQAAKAGTQEAADIFVVNKADKQEAELLVLQLQNAMDSVVPEKRPFITKTIASEGKGVEELTALFEEVRKRHAPFADERRRIRIENEIWSGAMREFEDALRTEAEAAALRVTEGAMTPFEAGERLGRLVTVRPFNTEN